MRFGTYTHDEFIRMVKAFHGSAAPGILLGGYMVNHAQSLVPGGALVDVICETKACLPDAIQLLTPCSYGNGWLRILDLGRFAAVFYDKHTGAGIRIHVDPARLEAWDEIQAWFLKQKPKQAQDPERLRDQIDQAGVSVFGVGRVNVHLECVQKERMGRVAICPRCLESYPEAHGPTCRGCSGSLPYVAVDR